MQRTIDTVLHVNAAGRCTIPSTIRSFLQLNGEPVELTITHNGTSITTVVTVSGDGRATIPIQVRRYLDIDGEAVELRVSLAPV